MATSESKLLIGQRRGRFLLGRIVGELVLARREASVSQAQLASSLGCSQSAISRLERLVKPDEISLVELSAVASLLGLEVSAGIHPVGDPIRDKGHQALIARFRAQLAAAWHVMSEAPLPLTGDRRAWDLLLRLKQQSVGVEAETRIRDSQNLVRHLRLRERDGGADAVVLVLARTRHNALMLPQLLEALGSNYATSPRLILGALRAGRPVPGSGVLLV
jgi:transcriptional regulator with XRE-family HTH domain